MSTDMFFFVWFAVPPGYVSLCDVDANRCLNTGNGEHMCVLGRYSLFKLLRLLYFQNFTDSVSPTPCACQWPLRPLPWILWIEHRWMWAAMLWYCFRRLLVWLWLRVLFGCRRDLVYWYVWGGGLGIYHLYQVGGTAVAHTTPSSSSRTTSPISSNCHSLRCGWVQNEQRRMPVYVH